MNRVRVKRIYDDRSVEDGQRILVDKLWPRGISRQRADLTLWAKGLAPSDDLRTRYHEKKIDWSTFKRDYYDQLDAKAQALAELYACLEHGEVTLLYASKEPRFNNAMALKEYIEAKVGAAAPGRNNTSG